MPLTRDFRETVKARVDRDPEFRAGLYAEAVQALLDGDLATTKILLRDFTNATVGFEKLSSRMDLPAKSVMRMLGPKGNPQASSLLRALSFLQEEAHLSVTVQAKPEPRRRMRHEAKDIVPA